MFGLETVDGRFVQAPSPPPVLLQAMLPDCVHPDASLYAFKAAREAQVLEQAVRYLN